MILGENFPPLGSDCQDRSRSVAGIVGRKGGRLAEGAGGFVMYRERERLARTADEGLLIGGRTARRWLRRTHERVHPDQGDPEQEEDRSGQPARLHHLQG
jgi:hypothetical protein